MREFTTAAKEAAKDQPDEYLPFEIDGVELRSYRPTDGQFALLMAAMAGDFAGGAEQAATLINFFLSVLDEEGRRYITHRLMDRSDSFGLENVTAILEWMTEEWSANPTKSSFVSMPSQPQDGESLTDGAQAEESTPSESDQLVSAT